MEMILPHTDGWSAIHLIEKGWGHIAVIVKREWRVASDGSTTPRSHPDSLILAEQVQMSQIDGEEVLVIVREAETALLKHSVDLHLLGIGTEWKDETGSEIDRARLTLNGEICCTYQRQTDAGIDPVNLFGFEPRPARIDTSQPFNFADHAPALFRSMRRSGDYLSASPPPNLAGIQQMQVTTTSNLGGSPEHHETVADCRVDVPVLEMHPFVWEGGRNDPPYWCHRPAQTLLADTLILSGDILSVLWRAALPLSDYPAADLRRLEIKEVV
jgi:hypothetical protein